MFCKNCGKEIDDNAAICPHCGVVVNSAQFQPVKQETNTIAIVGFILSFFTALIGLIVSCVGLKRSKELGGNGRGFAIAGIIIGGLEIALIVIIYIAVIGAALAAAGA